MSFKIWRYQTFSAFYAVMSVCLLFKITYEWRKVAVFNDFIISTSLFLLNSLRSDTSWARKGPCLVRSFKGLYFGHYCVTADLTTQWLMWLLFQHFVLPHYPPLAQLVIELTFDSKNNTILFFFNIVGDIFSSDLNMTLTVSTRSCTSPTVKKTIDVGLLSIVCLNIALKNKIH